MLAHAYNPRKALSFTLHVGDALTGDEMGELLSTIQMMTAAIVSKQVAFATVVVIVETAHSLNAAQRMQLAEGVRKLSPMFVALVTDSLLVRGVFTAVKWLVPQQGRTIGTFSRYEAARAWVVPATGYPAAIFDALHDEVRTKARQVRV